jgi:group I intron endonuclease
LEYCLIEELLKREKHFIDILVPEYNIVKDPTLPPMSGRKGENNPNFGQTLSEETRTKISDAKKGKPRPLGAGKFSQAIEVFDKETNQTTTYDSINEAARALNILRLSIVMYFKNNQQKPYKGRYTFKKIQGLG